MVCKRSAIVRLLGIDVIASAFRETADKGPRQHHDDTHFYLQTIVTPSLAVIGRNPPFAIGAFIIGQVQGALLPPVFRLARQNGFLLIASRLASTPDRTLLSSRQTGSAPEC
jgi:hypothetical protein